MIPGQGLLEICCSFLLVAPIKNDRSKGISNLFIDKNIFAFGSSGIKLLPLILLSKDLTKI